MAEEPSLYVWTKQGEQYQMQTLEPPPNNVSGGEAPQLRQEIFNQSQVPSSSCNSNTFEESYSRNFTCNECGKVFGKKSKYLNHQKCHTGIKTFQCSICEKIFASSRNLVIHSKVHTGEKHFKCSECEKTFASKSMLNAHQKTHAGERLYPCLDCGKSFHERADAIEKPYNCETEISDNTPLKQSSKRNLEIGPFVCPCCKEEFKKKCIYELHLMAHKGLKPEECEVCGRQFPSKRLLSSHRRIHSRGKLYSCDMCDRQFNRTVTLKRHLKYYHGFNIRGKGTNFFEERHRKPTNEVKSFKCDECDLAFTNNGKFLAHQKCHVSYRQYQCDKCNMSFANSYTLEVHQQMHVAEINSESVVPSAVTIPVMTLPVVTSVPSRLEFNEEKKNSFFKIGDSETPIYSPNNSENLGVLKIISLRSVEGEIKTDSHSDPLAMATAAAQLTTTDVENIALFDQSSYTYYINAVQSIEFQDSAPKLKRS